LGPALILQLVVRAQGFVPLGLFGSYGNPEN
jgi:hypothetical protein